MRHTLLAAMLLLLSSCAQTQMNLPQLQISENGHYLQTSDGTPFFYQGDTAWELFHRLDKDEADEYLKDRAEKGYNVIQAVALAELDGVDVPNAYGFNPLSDRDPMTPFTVDGDDNDYWDHVDYIIGKANSLGMYVALLPTWGRYWHDGTPLFTPQSAAVFGRWIADRYSKYDIIWVMGGDRNPNTPFRDSVIVSMAEAVKSADCKNLLTYHPAGGYSSSEWYHDAPWQDFNARQSSHSHRYHSNYHIIADFNRNPAKPIVEIEPLYEDHPIEFRPEDQGHSNASDARRTMYWSVFYGSAGVTYGHHSVWQMYDKDKGRDPINRPLMSWRKALDRPAAGQTIHLRRLMESRPYFTRIPAENLIVNEDIATYIPGSGRYRIAATMDSEGSYAMVYVPHGVEFSVNVSLLKADKLVAWWYCPRTGKATRIGKFSNSSDPVTFIPPMPGEPLDWVLVIDDAARHFSKPGR